MKLAVAGDAILTRPVSQVSDPQAGAIFDVLRSADLAFMNCETVIHDYRGPGLHPSAEAGLVAMQSPLEVAEEFEWLNARLLGMANNHSLDYGLGGLASTRAALDRAGVIHAGSGETLSEARGAAYFDGADTRVALVSMSTSATKESRAGDPFGGVPGRPGLNPLAYHFAGDAETIASVVRTAESFGMWVCRVGPDLWEINPPGLHNTVTRYYVTDAPGYRMVLDEEDVAANLRSIRNARINADIVIVHVHNHEWDTTTGSLRVPPDFMRTFAQKAIESGADVVVAQGSHAPIRGIEMHQGKPIFYDPGDLFLTSHHLTRHPRELYTRHAAGLDVPLDHALPSDGRRAMAAYSRPVSPAGGYFAEWGAIGAVATLEFDGSTLEEIRLHPFAHLSAPAGATSPRAGLSGVPMKPEAGRARDILEKFAALSEPFGTRIRIDDGVGLIVP